MPITSPVVLILGSGPNIGQHVARAFAAKGYKVALASRRLKEEDSTVDQVNIPSDLSDPDSVIGVFSKVKALLGLPSVVVYNGKNVSQYLKTPPKSCWRSWSRCSDSDRREESTHSPFKWLYSRLERQHNQRLRRCTASGFSLRTTPRFCIKNIHIHGQYIEHHNHATNYGFGSREVGDGAHYRMCCYSLRRSRFQVCISLLRFACEEIDKIVGSIMAMNGRLMGRLHSLILTERRMGNYTFSSLRARSRGLGNRHLLRV